MPASQTTRPAARASGNPATAGTVGELKQLGRYPTPRGERVLLAQRVHGRVRVTDRPLRPGGRAYLVASWVQSLDELRALQTDYLAQARQHGDCPMRCRW